MSDGIRILIEHGKHGDFLYDASTDEKLEANAKALLRERVASGYIHEPEKEPQRPTYVPRESAKDGDEHFIDELEDESLCKKATAKWNLYVQDKRRYAQQRRFWDELQACLNDEPDAPSAWSLLQERRNHEYEGIELQYAGMAR